MADQWTTIEVNLDPILDRIQPILDSIDSVLAALVAILNVVQAILNVIKVFLVGFLDPIRAIVELIITEIQNLIADLRQLGVYLAGDWELVESETQFQFLLGGYAAYERRMLSRLLDTRDPNRPNFTSSSAVIGIFLYASSGDIARVVRVIRAIMNFFGRGDLMGKARPYGTPTAPLIGYGTAAAGVASFRQLGQAIQDADPEKVSVTWEMPSGTLKGGILTPSPKGFLIHASTIPDGFQVLSVTPNDQSAEIEDVPKILSGAVDPTTNLPLRLYGGIADISVAEDAQDFSSVESDDEQAPVLLLQKDQNTPLIKPSTLAPPSGETAPLVGNTYFVKVGALAPQKIGPNTRYTATFNKSDLPKNASFKQGSDGYAEVEGTEEALNYWFRVRALTADWADEVSATGTFIAPANMYDDDARLFNFSRSQILTPQGVLYPEGTGNFNTGLDQLSFNHFTPAGGVGVATLPDTDQREFHQALQAAVALAILCRADLTEETGGEFSFNSYATGQGLGDLEGSARELFPRIGVDANLYNSNRPQKFRNRVKRALYTIEISVPPTDLASTIVSQAQNLLTFKWSDINSDYPDLTILESLGIGAKPSEDQGLGANPLCRTIPQARLKAQYGVPSVASANGPARGPSFTENPKLDRIRASSGREPGWVFGDGSADNSPILYNDSSGSVEFVRNAVTQHSGGVLLEEASLVMQIASAQFSRPQTDAQWIAIRLMPQALTPLDELLEKVDRFLQGVLDGLKGIIDQIVAYIEAIQSRIYQLQQLLELIRALLRAIQLFRLPSVSGLVSVESGTAGLVRALATSENKPVDTPDSYGAGVAIVAGGIPTVLLELLGLIFSGGES